MIHQRPTAWGENGEFLLEPFEPAYRSAGVPRLEIRARDALRLLEDCHCCPRRCHVNRFAGEKTFCGVGRYARVTGAFAHLGEEDCLRGWKGSGTLFFGLCNLQCVFCQNWDISQQVAGAEMTAREMAEMMLRLQDRGCHNINFVTPTHVIPQLLESVAEASARGLDLPIVYNTSAYDSVESLRLLEGVVDIYMPDFKFWNEESARIYCKAKDYPARAREAILEMHRQVGPLKFGPDGLARRGVLVRHLVMPGMLEDSKRIFEWLANEVSKDVFINIMGQYHPANRVGGRTDGDAFRQINRRTSLRELSEAVEAAREAGLWRFDEG